MEQKGGFFWYGNGVVVKAMVARLAGQWLDACGEDRAMASSTGALQEELMLRTGDEIFDFPVEPIVGDRFLKAARADLGGIGRQTRELIGLHGKPGERNGSPVRWDGRWRRGWLCCKK